MGPQPKIYKVMLLACGLIIAIIYSLCFKHIGPLYIYEYASSLWAHYITIYLGVLIGYGPIILIIY